MRKHIVFVEMSGTGAGEKALEYALGQGYHVSLLSRSPADYPQEALREVRVIHCETNDVDLLIREVKALDRMDPIDGVTTTADFYVPQAAAAAEALDLPTMSYEAAIGARNKYRMRMKLQQHCPELNPPFRLVHSEKEALEVAKEWGYPLIAKPQDANDSLNVLFVTNEQELSAYMQESRFWDVNSAGQSYAEGVLLEGYIEGKEFSVETLQYKGDRCQLIGIIEKVWTGTAEGHFAEIGVNFPVETAETKPLFQAISVALSHLNIDCGVIHTECRIQNGQIKILEINPRLAGDMAGSHMIELALGASPIQQVVEIALGNHVPWQPTKKVGAALYGVSLGKNGFFQGLINEEEILAMPGVCHMKVMAKEGQYYHHPPQSNQDFIARLVTEGKTPEDALDHAIKAAQETQKRIIIRGMNHV